MSIHHLVTNNHLFVGLSNSKVLKYIFLSHEENLRNYTRKLYSKIVKLCTPRPHTHTYIHDNHQQQLTLVIEWAYCQCVQLQITDLIDFTDHRYICALTKKMDEFVERVVIGWFVKITWILFDPDGDHRTNTSKIKNNVKLVNYNTYN